MIKNTADCVRILKENGLLKEADPCDAEISGVTYDSRCVEPGFLFVCKGEHFRKAFLEEAAKAGACVYVSEERYDLSRAAIPAIIVSDIRRSMMHIGLEFYDYPSEQLKIAGFTATKGKTTTTHLFKAAMDRWLSEKNSSCALLSGSIMTDGISSSESVNTTPESMELQKWLRRISDNGLEYCALEVSSQALKYCRTSGTRIRTAAFMNISRDHISPREHPDFEDYFCSKLSIFDNAETGIVNLDMDHADRVLEYARMYAGEVISFSMTDPEADLLISGISGDDEKICFRLRIRGRELFRNSGVTEDTEESFSVSMPGSFNAANASAAVAACLAMGEPLKYIKEGISGVHVAGRMETFVSSDGKLIAIADYAHNRLSLESLIASVREAHPAHSRNMIVITGSVGDKAFERRKELGTIAGMNASKTYIVPDNPGHEPLSRISGEIAHFVGLQGGKYEIMDDRSKAIEKAIGEADEPSVILACGFGRDNTQKYGDEVIAIESDADCIQRCIADYDRTH